MTLDLDESVAQAMETDVRLLPLLPELLTDLWEFGPSAEQVVAALESVGVSRIPPFSIWPAERARWAWPLLRGSWTSELRASTPSSRFCRPRGR